MNCVSRPAVQVLNRYLQEQLQTILNKMPKLPTNENCADRSTIVAK